MLARGTLEGIDEGLIGAVGFGLRILKAMNQNDQAGSCEVNFSPRFDPHLVRNGR